MTGPALPSSPSPGRAAALSLLIFDLDGVLADTSGCHARAWDALWGHIGVEGPPYAQIAGRSTAEVVRERTSQLSPSAAQITAWVDRKQSDARERLRHEPIAFPDTREVMKDIVQQEFMVSLGTSASAPSVDLVLDRLGLRDAFDHVVTAADVQRAKPDPEVYRRLVELAGTDPARVLVVEDSPAGVEAGLAAGANVVSVRSGATHPDPRFEGALGDLHELLAHLCLGGGRT